MMTITKDMASESRPDSIKQIQTYLQEIKNSIESIQSRINQCEDRIFDLEDRVSVRLPNKRLLKSCEGGEQL